MRPIYCIYVESMSAVSPPYVHNFLVLVRDRTLHHLETILELSNWTPFRARKWTLNHLEACISILLFSMLKLSYWTPFRDPSVAVLRSGLPDNTIFSFPLNVKSPTVGAKCKPGLISGWNNNTRLLVVGFITDEIIRVKPKTIQSIYLIYKTNTIQYILNIQDKYNTVYNRHQYNTQYTTHALTFIILSQTIQIIPYQTRRV